MNQPPNAHKTRIKRSISWLAVVIIITITCPISPSQANAVSDAAQNISRQAFVTLMHTIYSLLNPWFNPRQSPPTPENEDPTQRAAQVVSLQMCPQRLLLYIGEEYKLVPLPFDNKGYVVHGAACRWTTSNKAIADVASDGTVVANQSGQCSVTVTVGAVNSPVTVEVRAGLRPVLTNAQWETEHAQDCGETVPYVFDPEEPVNRPAAAHPTNATGHPRFTPGIRSQSSAAGTDEQLGSSNFSFGVPIFSSHGRGVGVGLELAYNSRVWTKDGNIMQYDYDQGWPAPGFRLNYGRIIRDYNVPLGDPGGHYLLIQADGTRVPLLNQGSGKYRSNDGQHIEFKTNFSTTNPIDELTYPDGTVVKYANINNKLQPYSIQDINGNSITIDYVANCSSALRVGACTCGSGCQRPSRQALHKISDTLGRHVIFYYYADGNLAEIRVPSYNTGSDRVLVKFYYQTVALSYNFGSMQVTGVPPGNQISALRRVYFPDTGMGYVFDEYSSYGMYTRISRRLGMTNTSEGTEVAYTKYNHQTSGQLSDAPKFNERLEWWQEKTSATGTPDSTPSVYTYTRQTSGGSETNSIISLANNISTEMTSSSTTGLLSTHKVVNSSGVTMFQQDYTYSSASSQEGLQRTRIETTPDGVTANKMRVDTTYGLYGRLEQQTEHGFAVSGTFKKRRRTTYEYQDGASYTDKGLLRLVTQVKVYDAKETDTVNDDDLISRSRYTYDDNSDSNWSVEQYGFTDGCGQPDCTPPPGFNTRIIGRAARGNISKMELWSNAVSANPDISFRHRYDIFGNEVKSETSCCSLNRATFNQTMWYSVPVSVISGGVTGPTLTTSRVYDLNTSFIKSSTDPNNLVLVFAPDSAMRVLTVTYPKLASDSHANPVLETSYNDPAYPNQDGLIYQTKLTYRDGGTEKIDVSKQWLDGMGRMIRSGIGFGANPASFDATKTVYDAMGRVTQTSNPYSSNQNGNPTGTVYWTVYEYDDLNRVFKLNLPDGNWSNTTYSGAVRTITDQVGRQRRMESDGLGRITKVTEMDNSKQLTWETTYAYDLLNNLLSTNQGNQVRTFKYDSLSRLRFERTREQDATINDGTGTMWSTSYTYNEFSAVGSRTDARGVTTTYGYDTLNRMQSVSYNVANTNPPVPATSGVTINYGTVAPKKGKIESINDALGTESYQYDDLSRTQSKTRSIDSRNYTTAYQYNQVGQLKKLTYPSLRQVDMGYDSRGRLTSLSGTRAYINDVVYTPAQQMERIELANGITETFGYSANRLQLTSQTVQRGQNPAMMSTTYNYNADTTNGGGTRSGNSGQLMAITSTINGQTRNQSFKYDQVARLTYASGSDSGGQWQRGYDYDRWGNRTKVWDLSAGVTNQTIDFQLAVGVPITNRASTVWVRQNDIMIGLPQAYDKNGNLNDDGDNSHIYDAENRVTRSTRIATGAQTDYQYDSANRRAKKQSNTTTTHYLWEGDRIIAEHNGATGAVIADYVYAGGRMIAREAGGAVRYFHHDRLSARMITDVNGNWVGTMSHQPFGEQLTETGEQDKHRFTTYERDDETGTDHAINRQYSPVTGRFMRPDPVSGSIRNPQSLNRYSYVSNDPVNLIDPLGLVRVNWFYFGGMLFMNPNFTFDGATAGPEMLGLALGLWASGAADIGVSGPGLTRNRRGDWFQGENSLSSINDLWRAIPVGQQYDLSHLVPALRDAIDLAIEVLRSRWPCAKLLSGPYVKDPYNFFLEILAAKKLVEGETGSASAKTVFNTFLGIRLDFDRIVIGDNFFGSGLAQHKGWFPGATDKQIFALMILHELGHATRAEDSKHGEDDAKHKAYDKAIYEKCLADDPGTNVTD
jgi:RHS repeat-associated protein